MSQRASRSEGSGKVDQCTPEIILDAVRKVFGGQIAFDPCSNPASIVGAKRSIMLPEYEPAVGEYARELGIEFGNGLEIPWETKAFVNHPFGVDHNRFWGAKIDSEATEGKEIITLTPASPGAKWWRPFWKGLVCFLHQRVVFLNRPVNPKTGKLDGADFEVAICYRGCYSESFVQYFSPLGTIACDVNKAYRGL